MPRADAATTRRSRYGRVRIAARSGHRSSGRNASQPVVASRSAARRLRPSCARLGRPGCAISMRSRITVSVRPSVVWGCDAPGTTRRMGAVHESRASAPPSRDAAAGRGAALSDADRCCGNKAKAHGFHSLDHAPCKAASLQATWVSCDLICLTAQGLLWPLGVRENSSRSILSGALSCSEMGQSFSLRTASRSSGACAPTNRKRSTASSGDRERP
jgi:hypothetical protein